MPKIISNIAQTIPTRCLRENCIREIFIKPYTNHNGQTHEQKRVCYYPEKIHSIEIGVETVFLVEAKNVSDCENEKAFVIPLFELSLNNGQKHQIIRKARKQKIPVSWKHFKEPQISISYPHGEETINPCEEEED